MLLEIVERICTELQLEQIVVTSDESSLDAARQQNRHFRSQRLARMHVCEDAATFEDAFEQDLHLPASRLDAQHARRNHARVIEDEQILGPKQLQQVGKVQVREGPMSRIDAQQPAARPFGSRMLSDQLGRKFVGKVAASHGPRKVAARYRP